ncbi:hypothetical protein ACS0TY_027671 [Phlomoides rotata]
MSNSYQHVGCMDSSQRPHLYMNEHLFHDLLSPPHLQQPKDREDQESPVLPSESFHILDMPTENIIKLGAQNFISLSSLSHQYPCSTSAHSKEDCKGIQLVENLLSCAKKVSENQYEIAVKFLKACDTESSPTGTPIQRLVFYFSEALLHKIAKETARILRKDSQQTPVDPLELVMIPNMPLQIAFYKEYPLARIQKLVGVQAVLDHLIGAKKIHIIDLVIRSGTHWIILMQALASRNEHLVEHFKITVVAKSEWKAMMEELGKQLASLAHSFHLNFSFKIVLVDDILQLDPTRFDRAGDESVSVYACHALMSMVGRVDRLDHLMTVMRSLSPCVMIVTETEVNCNSPNFIGRFVESLFFFGALFDSLSDCFKNDEANRVNAESTWFRSSIKNILTTEGEQRKIRNVDMKVWRAFFARHGLVETELSISVSSPLDQARMGLQSLACGRSCTLYMDGKCLIVGWKGTPLISVSAWKFQ